ncbi:MAG: hypothetical protein P4L99_07295 [Chthoniobacter sp.]|nr:hypothetical protein [Chthoniobacter sp.]
MRGLCVAVLLALTICDAGANDTGLFVAVGYGGRRITSRDGVVWENDQRWSDEAKDNDDVLFNVAFGAGRFIAVGGGAQTGHILATTDGREWKSLQDVKGRVATVAFGQGRFVAGHDAELMYSTTGERFEYGPRLDWKGSVHARRSACGDTEAGFRFVIIGDVDLWAEKKRVSWRGVTGDGTRWEQTTLDAPAARDIAYGAGHFVVVGPGGLVESSHDGQAWERHETDPAEDLSHVVWTGARFLVSGGKANWSSPDALTWTKLPRGIPCSIAWAREGFLGLGFSWGGNIHLSRDFVEWKKVTGPSGPSLNAVAFGQL